MPARDLCEACPLPVPVPPALRRFIWDIQSMVELAESDREILVIGRDLMRRLVTETAVVPPAFRPAPERGRQVQLYADAMERFAVTASFLDPGEALPVIAEPAWQILGVAEGSVVHRRISVTGDGIEMREARALPQGAVDCTPASPEREALQLVNPGPDAAIVIHAFGADVGSRPRTVFTATGADAIVTGYANPAEAPAYDIHAIQADIRD